MLYFAKYLVVILLFIIFSACSTKKIPFPEEDNIVAIKSFIKNYCPLNSYLDTTKDIVLATLYFKENNYSLTTHDKYILDKVVQMFSLCNNKILVIGYISTHEFKQNTPISKKLSYLRAYNTYNYLKQYIPLNYIYFSFCSNLKSKYIESNSAASLGNQRAEIIMLGSSISKSLFQNISK